MIDAVLVVAILGSFYGFLYPVGVGAVLGLCVLARRSFRPRPGQWLPLLAAPAATYYLLSYLIAGRQGWNTPYAVIALTAAGALVVVVACLARRPAWLRAGTALGIAVAFAIWRVIPYQGMTRLF